MPDRKGENEMYDVLTVAAVVDELTATVLDGRIQKIGLVNQLEIALEVYARHRRRALVASATASSPGLSLVERLPSTDPSLITPFGLQLRKYVRGGFLVGVDQPPMERIVRFSIVKRLGPHNDKDEPAETDDEPDSDDDGDAWSHDANRVDLIVETMGRHSNILLVDADGSIMESAKRVTSHMSRVRPILPRLPYTPPPIPDRPDPRLVTSTTAGTLLAAAKPGARIAETLVRGMRGVSPQIAREVAFRIAGSPDAQIVDLPDETAVDLARTVRNLFEPMLTHTWQPVVYEQDGEPIAYAATPMQHLAAIADEREVESISEAIETLATDTVVTGPRDHAQRRARIAAAVGREEDRVRQRLHALREQHRRSEQAEALRTWGEMIFAYLWQIQPGDTVLAIEGMDDIPLDPSMSAKDNAQHYFDEYRKAQRAGSQLPEHIATAETELSYLDQLRTQVEQADGFAAIEALRQEFEDHTGGRQEVGERPGSRSRRKENRRVAGMPDAAGNMVFIGRSGRENDQVTFDIGGPEDTWLHARGVPGSHVIIRWQRPTDDEDETSVETAAAIAAYYSRSRNSGTVEVDVTRRKNVRKIKGAGPGMVTYRNERTIVVRPQDEAALRASGHLE
ncbi:MAG TPA: NFACT RNA binding domain-containing protein [Thermomicrobiales bacterium]|nr:NFACT RNA binding domain-containing protein [Thermomicrobiales bacterium]